MDRKELIEFLNDYKSLEERAVRLENKLYSIKAVNLEESDTGGVKRTLVDNLHDLERYKLKMNEILELINSDDNAKENMLLKYKYVEGVSISDIAHDNLMGYSHTQLKRIHSRAIEKLLGNVNKGVVKITTA